jgi:Mn2+/Fe2+ NRAMP family transporter
MTGISDTTPPPRTLRESLSHLGPGIVLASSIVGSGELIATTTVGAEAGFLLLWLIVIGCAIKVAAQIEIGRATLTWGRTPLAAFDGIPGPRVGGRGWLFWGWAAMTALILVQQGGILAGVAQTLAAGVPLTPGGSEWNSVHDEAAACTVAEAEMRRGGDASAAATGHRLLEAVRAESATLVRPIDDTIWMVVTALVTMVLLAVGRYRFIERASIAMVGTFTLVTIAALVVLQFNAAWSISANELASGLVPSIPPAIGGRSPLMTGLATFGIIGVGASELMIYPYWCLEKGYGRAVGPRDESPEWAARARGWLGVMRLDAWASMVVYTIVTVAFYLLGAATLGRLGLRPEGGEMVRTLGSMYAPVFGPAAPVVFLVGGFAVLYSTLFVAAAGNARMIVDALVLASWLSNTTAVREAWTRGISAAWIAAALALAIAIREPVGMVLASGAAQAIMLVGLAIAVINFRYGGIDARLAPSPAWDLLLWVSSTGFVVIGLWTVWEKLQPLWATASGG